MESIDEYLLFYGLVSIIYKSPPFSNGFSLKIKINARAAGGEQARPAQFVEPAFFLSKMAAFGILRSLESRRFRKHRRRRTVTPYEWGLSR
jgi:hypothetical protein